LDVKSARQMALGGYKELFQDWLPYYRSFGLRPQDDSEVRPQDDTHCHSERSEESSNSACHSERSNPCHSERSNPCHSERSEESALIMTLLRIMSTLDDTCIIKRVGVERAQEVKREAANMLASDNCFSQGFANNQFPEAFTGPAHTGLQEMCSRYAAEGISPGGAADMLALTIFIDTLIL
jgi:triphosphoribosyl-dephospho-CoA synthase